MSEIKDILTLHDQASQRSEKIAFATVISTEGPSYRSAGSRSLVIENGIFGGGLSAGCLEGDIACRLDGNTAPFIVEYDLSEEDDIRGFPFGCGGTVQVFVEPLPNTGALDAVRWLSELHETAVLLTVVRSHQTSQITGDNVEIGARFGLSESGSSFTSEGLPNLAASEFKAICESVVEEQNCGILVAEIQDQKLTVFVELFEPAIHVAIFGDGEDARVLDSLANQIGMSVQRINRHEIRASVSLLEEIPSLAGSYVVVMTHDLNLDTKVLNQLLTARTPYLGVMGPRSRTEKILTSLGADPVEILNRSEVYSPVGLNMAAETPSEIALSIIAEIQTVSRKVQPKHLRDSSGAIHDRWQKTSSNACDPKIETRIGA